MTRVLVVDDEPQILRALAINLRARHYEVFTRRHRRRGARGRPPRTRPTWSSSTSGLPDIDGVEVIRGLRGWSTRADHRALRTHRQRRQGGRPRRRRRRLRHQAVRDGRAARPDARRVTPGHARPTQQPAVTLRARRTVDLAARRVTVRDGDGVVDVRLTPTEWHLLEVLLRHPGKLLSQRQLLTEVWGPGYETAGGQPAASTWRSCAASSSRTRRARGTCSPSRAWATASSRSGRTVPARDDRAPCACRQHHRPSGPPTAGHQPGVMGQGGRGGTLTWCTTWWTTWCTTTSTGATATSTVPCTFVAPDPR